MQRQSQHSPVPAFPRGGMETHGDHFQEMDDIAGKILVNVVLTVALENVLFCWKPFRRSTTDLQTLSSHSKVTEANIYGYSYCTTATKQLYVDGTTTMGDRY